MSREDAIELLDNLIGMVEDNHNSDYDTAFKMAIKALEQEPKTGHPQKSCDTCEYSDEIDGSNCYECVKDMRNNYSPKKMEPCGDLISKQSVLNACEQSINILEAVDRIMDLPSVEQEPSEDCIKRQAVLNLIEHYNSDGLGSVFYGYEEGVKFANAVNKLPPVNPHVSCGDAVSRQAALDAMYELCNTGETLEENPWRDNPHIDAITDAINNLQPIKPQDCDICEVGSPCLYCKHEFEPQESEGKE